MWREEGNSEVVFGQVKSEIHCEWTGEGRRVSRSVGLGCRERSRVEPGSPPLREGIERTVDVTESERLPGVQDCLEVSPQPCREEKRRKASSERENDREKTKLCTTRDPKVQWTRLREKALRASGIFMLRDWEPGRMSS